MRVLVCGGRFYNDRDQMWPALDSFLEIHGDALVIIQGAAPGADTCAERWAKAREVTYIGCPAKWRKYGNAAGPIRNQAMIDDHDPEVCLAFHGGRGTEDMISKATAKKIPVHRVPLRGA